MFPELPAFDADETFLHAIGRSGGLCDCGDVGDAPASLGEEAAGWPIFGQFIAHDVTADRSALRSHVDPRELRNARAPQLNLECLYGDGPIGHPFLYQRDDPAKFLLGLDKADVPRHAEGVAIVGDPRNDSHVLMSQMHLGRSLVEQVSIEGPLWFRPADHVFIPLEFADAAYRYGHCQIRHRYRLNQQIDPAPLFPDLLGFRPVARDRTVDWTLFFDVAGRQTAQRAKKIDGRLVRSLIDLPVAITGECEIEEYHSLAARDLQRGQSVGLPSGESIARHVGAKPLTPDEVGLPRLGPIGGRIVTEVLVTLIDRDPGSVRRAGPGWRPRRSLIDLFASANTPTKG
jgi:hypothetical protein